MKFLKPFLAALLLLVFTACQHHKKAEVSSAIVNKMSDTMSYNNAGTLEPAGNSEDQFKVADQKQEEKKNEPQGPAQKQPVINPDWDKKIVKTATIAVETEDYQQYNEVLKVGVKQLGGYIAMEEQTESDYKIENTLLIKIPVDKFDEAINKLVTGKEKTIARKITSDDVTTEVVDVKSRMEAKRQVRQRYLDLLKQARNMEEILQVQSEINEIQVEIESAAARVEYLTNSAAYSTIHLNFSQIINPSAKNHPEPSFGLRIVDSFKNGLTWVGELMILLITLWPAVLIITLIWLGIRKYKPFAVKKS
jgi:hypothetical protein